MSRLSLALWLGLGMVTIAGCRGNRSAPDSAGVDPGAPGIAYSALGRTLIGGVRACGEVSVRPRRLVFVTGKACLGCRDVGHLLRELSRERHRPADALLVGVPQSDTAMVCQFIREERIAATVLGVPVQPGEALARSPLIAYGLLDEGQRLIDSAVAPDGGTLLSMLQYRTGPDP